MSVAPPTTTSAADSAPVDEERSQALARLVIGVPCVAAFMLMAWRNELDLFTAYSYAVPVISAVVVFSGAWFAIVSRYPGACPPRRLVTVVFDLGMVSWGIAQAGEYGVVFYPLILWVIVGNAIRFGVGYLWFGLVIGQLGHVAIYLMSPYWHDNPTLSFSLQAASIILPLFYLSTTRRLHALNARLAEEAQRSRMAAESKAQFLANMSHELRTPMNGVLGIAQLLRDTRLDARQQEYLDLIYRSADGLLGIINDILDFSKIDAGKLTLEQVPFDLRGCIDDVVHLLEHKASEKALTLRTEFPSQQPDCFIGDRARVRQILMNLVGNAIKFTEHGSVTVRCDCGSGPDGLQLVRIEVADTGVGIAPQDLERIFGQFEQAEVGTFGRFGGTGLGLAISRRLARSMQGDLTVESRPGAGSTFRFELPLTAVTRDEVTRMNKQVVVRNYDVRALLAEDNRVNQIVAQGLLRKVGIRVDIAEDGAEAVALYQAGDYRLVLMDLQMPKLDGAAAARQIRALQTGAAPVPIIALSANMVGDMQQSDRHDGTFDGFVSKPFKLQDLVEAVDGVLLD